MTTAHHGVRLRVRSGGRREILGGGAALVEDEYLCSQLTQSQAQSQLAADVPQDSTVSCVCGSRHRDSLMLQCLHCSQQQHGACYRVLVGDEVPAQHCCVECSREQGRDCTDPRLARMFARPGDKASMRNTCAYRRILASLVTADSVTADSLCSSFGLEEELGEQAIGKLVKDGVVREDRTVDREVLLNVALPKYLKKRARCAGGQGDVAEIVQGAERMQLEEGDVKEEEKRPKKMKMSKNSSDIGFN